MWFVRGSPWVLWQNILPWSSQRHLSPHAGIPNPTAWIDDEDAFHCVHDHLSDIGGDGKQVVIGGVSSGAYLTASLVLAQHVGAEQALSKRPKIKGWVLMIPPLVSVDYYIKQLAKLKDPQMPSYMQNEHAPILPVSRIGFFNALLKSTGDETDLRLNPGNATADEVKGLPPTTFGNAGRDPLRDQGLFYAKLLSENGVPTDINIFTGVPHGFRFHESLSGSKR